MPRAIRGVLIECDPSIHSIISKFDAENHDYVIEDLDETHVVIKETMLPLLKKKLDDFLSSTREPVQQDSGSEVD